LFIQNLSILTWDVLISCFILISVFLYFIKSGKRAIILFFLGIYIGYAVAGAMSFLNGPYSYYPVAVLMIVLAFALKMFGKFIFVKHNSLTFFPTILFSILASGMLSSAFFKLISGNELINLAPIVENVFTNSAVHFSWLILPLFFIYILRK